MNLRTSKLRCLAPACIILAAAIFAFAAQNDSIKVSVSSAKVEKGGSVRVTVATRLRGVKAVIVRPGIGVEPLDLKAEGNGRDNILVGAVQVPADAPDGLYVIHAWAGDARRPTAVAKANFRTGSIIADFIIGNYVDNNGPAADIDAYLKDFRSVGGNFLIAHNLIIAAGAFYSSKTIKRGSDADLVELVLARADRQGIPVLLSVSWDMTRSTPFAGRLSEIKAIADEMYELYRHHPSLAGFYTYQEGSGTYYAAFVREFSDHIKSLDRGLITACAPHIDDPLLAGYLSMVDSLDMMIYQSAVMASYRTDNRKKYPPRRVRDFSGLGAGAKRAQNKITLTHVELFAYLERRRRPDVVTAEYSDIFDQILSAASVTDADGIALFAYHPHIFKGVRDHPDMGRSRAAVADGLRLFKRIASDVSFRPNPLALYIPYSDFIIERWNNYFIPALDAFRRLGVPIDIVPYAPPADESVLPYYPFHMNPAVLERLLRDRTVLVLANVSGFQQTDSDLIKEFIRRGGVVVAFGPQIPMGRSYERSEMFSGDDSPARSRPSIVVRNAAGFRVARGQKFTLSGGPFPGWIVKKQVNVIAEYPDGTAAAFVTKFGKGSVVTIMPDAAEAAARFPALTRDVLDLALGAAGQPALLDVTGSNENVETSVRRSDDGVYFSFVNENDRGVTLRVGPGPKSNKCFNINASVPLPVSLIGGRLILQLGSHEAGIWECKPSP